MRSKMKLCVTTLLLTLTVLGLGWMANAQSTDIAGIALAPTYNGVACASYVTVSQKSGPVTIKAYVTDPKGVSSATISSHAGTGTGFGYGAKSLTLSTVFYGAYYKVGDYPVTMSANGGSGSLTWKGVIHLVP